MLEGIDCGSPGFPGSPLSNVGFQYSPTIKDAYQYFVTWGRTQSSYIVDQSQGKANIIRSNYLGGLGQAISTGDKQILSKCSGCTSHDLTWSQPDQTTDLKEKFTTMLLQYPQANAAIVDFDTNAVTAGLSQAVVTAGRKNSMIVVSGEGDAAYQTLMANGAGANGAAPHDGHWIGWAAMDELNRFFDHSPAVPEGIGFRVADKYHNGSPGKDYASPIPWKADYLKTWKAAGAPS
jgi:ribose transport system substrate-binding protein